MSSFQYFLLVFYFITLVHFFSIHPQEALPKSDIEIPEIVYSESNTAKKESGEKYLNGEDKSNKEELIKLASENKIEAIKKYMELYNVGLTEAKIAIEKMLN